MASNTRYRQRWRHVLERIALRSGESPDRSGEAPDEPAAPQERPAKCSRALSVDAHDRERMRAAPGVDAAMPDANEAKAFIAESGGVLAQ